MQHKFILKQLQTVKNDKTQKVDFKANIIVSEDNVVEALSTIDMAEVSAQDLDLFVPDSFRNKTNGRYYASLWPTGKLLDKLQKATYPCVVHIDDTEMIISDIGYDMRDGQRFFHLDYQPSEGTVERYDARKHGIIPRIRNRNTSVTVAPQILDEAEVDLVTF